MVKYLFAFFMLMHGLIHLMGFAKAFGIGNITQLSKTISKQSGIYWFLATLLFIGSLIFYLLKVDWWPVITIIAVILSQALVIYEWKDAKFGTIANLVILLVAIATYANFRFITG